MEKHRDGQGPPKSSQKTITVSMIDELSKGQDLNTIDALNFTLLAKRSYKFTSIANLDCVPNLSELNLSYNSISNLQNLSGLKCLKTLNIAENLISDLKPIFYNTSLTILNINGNLIEFIPEEIGNLEFLETLKISRNRLGSEDSISNLIYTPRLTHLTLVGNPLTKIENYRDVVTKF
jgi:Leucine-rich repeat (LRR) protein